MGAAGKRVEVVMVRICLVVPVAPVAPGSVCLSVSGSESYSGSGSSSGSGSG